MQQKTILCYGDSNTWGFVPLSDHSLQKKRYARNERWPGLLQEKLGNDFYVIEEGLNGRTTDVDYHIPPDRNGKTYLPSCLYSHAPIDLVILALGGNDFKSYFNRDSKDIKNGLAALVDVIQGSIEYGPELQSAPKLLITTAVVPLASVESYLDDDGIEFLKGCFEKSKELVGLFKDLAREKSCYFADVSEIALPSEVDGVHYDKVGHLKFAEEMYDKVLKIL